MANGLSPELEASLQQGLLLRNPRVPALDIPIGGDLPLLKHEDRPPNAFVGDLPLAQEAPRFLPGTSDALPTRPLSTSDRFKGFLSNFLENLAYSLQTSAGKGFGAALGAGLAAGGVRQREEEQQRRIQRAEERRDEQIVEQQRQFNLTLGLQEQGASALQERFEAREERLVGEAEKSRLAAIIESGRRGRREEAALFERRKERKEERTIRAQIEANRADLQRELATLKSGARKQGITLKESFAAAASNVRAAISAAPFDVSERTFKDEQAAMDEINRQAIEIFKAGNPSVEPSKDDLAQFQISADRLRPFVLEIGQAVQAAVSEQVIADSIIAAVREGNLNGNEARFLSVRFGLAPRPERKLSALERLRRSRQASEKERERRFAPRQPLRRFLTKIR